jgi:hypothetical protein
MTKDEIINYIKSKYPEDKIYKSKVHISEHINVTRGPAKERWFDHIIRINSEEKVVNIWWTFFNSCHKRIYINYSDNHNFNDKNLKEQIDKCHESYDDARKELHKHMKELLKAKVNEL